MSADELGARIAASRPASVAMDDPRLQRLLSIPARRRRTRVLTGLAALLAIGLLCSTAVIASSGSLARPHYPPLSLASSPVQLRSGSNLWTAFDTGPGETRYVLSAPSADLARSVGNVLILGTPVSMRSSVRTLASSVGIVAAGATASGTRAQVRGVFGSLTAWRSGSLVLWNLAITHAQTGASGIPQTRLRVIIDRFIARVLRVQRLSEFAGTPSLEWRHGQWSVSLPVDLGRMTPRPLWELEFNGEGQLMGALGEYAVPRETTSPRLTPAQGLGLLNSYLTCVAKPNRKTKPASLELLSWHPQRLLVTQGQGLSASVPGWTVSAGHDGKTVTLSIVGVQNTRSTHIC
jgi:hypothetical protein